MVVFFGKGLCPMEVSTRHVWIRTRVQEWTHVHNPTCPVETYTEHKPYLSFFEVANLLLEIYVNAVATCRNSIAHGG